MKNFFENKITFGQISFCLSNKPTIDEREIHSYHEILLYIDGEVELFSANGRRTLKRSSLIIIPEETYHFLNTKNNNGFERLKISIPKRALDSFPLDSIMKELRIIEELEGGIKFIYDKLVGILRANEKNAAAYAYSALLMLISELDMHNAIGYKKLRAPKNELAVALSDYISKNLAEPLDIKTLAEKMHTSPSSITHVFKSEFGIPIHKYVLQKRLVLAKRLVSEGELLSKKYAEVGFRDYSSLYKAYLHYFGYPPSKEKRKTD